MKIMFQVYVCPLPLIERHGLEFADNPDNCTFLTAFQTREEAQHYADNIAHDRFHINGIYKVFVIVYDAIHSSRVFR